MIKESAARKMISIILQVSLVKEKPLCPMPFEFDWVIKN